jgi:NAD(P)-dependent dehydrogenase (short-subunit alcohol dehydrogenase family)
MSSGRFEGTTALVTGAGGDIGAATALRMATEGAALVLFDRKDELLGDSVAACTDAGAEVHAFGVDQTDRARVEEAVEQAWERTGRIDAVFANAGYGRFSPFLSISERDWHRHVDVNFSGTFHVCQSLARRMAEDRGGGSIVVNESSGAETHADQLAAYCATKAGLRMLVKGMAAELGTHRIRVNGVMPGVIETGMTAPMLADQRHRDVMLAETPAGRLGLAEDVAALVCFLSSTDAGYITGESVLIDGGQTIHGHPRWFRLDYREAHEERWEVGR